MRTFVGCVTALSVLSGTMAGSQAQASDVQLVVNPATGALSVRSTVSPSYDIIGYSIGSSAELLTSGDITLSGTFQTLLNTAGEVTVWTPPGPTPPGPTIAIPLSGRGLLTNVTWTGLPSHPLSDLNFYFGGTGPTAIPGDVKLLGDFDNTDSLQANDIDLLSAAVRGGVNPLQYDLTGDGLVNQADRQNWVLDLKQTRFGDANLDGDVDVFQFNGGGDAQILTSNLGSVGGLGWGDGDFNGDDDVDVFQFDGLGDAQLLTSNLGFGGDSAFADAALAGTVTGTYDPSTGVVTLDIGSGVGVVGLESPGNLRPDQLSGALSAAQATSNVIAFFNPSVLPVGVFNLGAIVTPGTAVSAIGFSYTPIGQQSIVGSLTVVPEPAAGLLAALVAGVAMRQRTLLYT